MTRPVLRGLQTSPDLFVSNLPFELFRCDAIRQPWRWFWCCVMGACNRLTLSSFETQSSLVSLPILAHWTSFTSSLLYFARVEIILICLFDWVENLIVNFVPRRANTKRRIALSNTVLFKSKCAVVCPTAPTVACLPDTYSEWKRFSLSSSSENLYIFGFNFMQFNFINSTLFATLANHKCKF